MLLFSLSPLLYLKLNICPLSIMYVTALITLLVFRQVKVMHHRLSKLGESLPVENKIHNKLVISSVCGETTVEKFVSPANIFYIYVVIVVVTVWTG